MRDTKLHARPGRSLLAVAVGLIALGAGGGARAQGLYVDDTAVAMVVTTAVTGVSLEIGVPVLDIAIAHELSAGREVSPILSTCSLALASMATVYATTATYLTATNLPAFPADLSPAQRREAYLPLAGSLLGVGQGVASMGLAIYAMAHRPPVDVEVARVARKRVISDVALAAAPPAQRRGAPSMALSFRF